jgi:hypothetical protein
MGKGPMPDRQPIMGIKRRPLKERVIFIKYLLFQEEKRAKKEARGVNPELYHEAVTDANLSEDEVQAIIYEAMHSD